MKLTIIGATGAVIALVVTLASSGCTTARTPPAGAGSTTIAAPATATPASPTAVNAKSAPATTASTPATAAPATAAPATAAPPARTQVETFSPWTAAGTLRPGINVVVRSSGTGCTRGSAFDAGNQYAWRCFQASGAFYDPCFAPPARSGVTQVACMDAPWSGARLITLARPLARSSWGTPRPTAAEYPWAMVLANGQRCGLIEGTAPVTDGIGLYFGCPGGAASYPSTASEPWTVNYAANGSKSLTPIAVTTAWA
jgi:hypothetical protein